jgi:hypothetical protein
MTNDNIFPLEKILYELHHVNIYCKFFSYKSVLGSLGQSPKPTRLLINLNGFCFTISYNGAPKINLWKN